MLALKLLKTNFFQSVHLQRAFGRDLINFYCPSLVQKIEFHAVQRAFHV